MADEPYVTKTGMVVDPSRLKRNGETLMFTPFTVELTEPIGSVLEHRTIPPDTDLLVAVRDDDRVIALSRQQMAYHHVAQGQLDGEPWVVFF
ncbi:MAG: hypothetical protein AAGF11_51000 [Myxococcota bacterium]